MFRIMSDFTNNINYSWYLILAFTRACLVIGIVVYFSMVWEDSAQTWRDLMNNHILTEFFCINFNYNWQFLMKKYLTPILPDYKELSLNVISLKKMILRSIYTTIQPFSLTITIKCTVNKLFLCFLDSILYIWPKRVRCSWPAAMG